MNHLVTDLRRLWTLYKKYKIEIQVKNSYRSNVFKMYSSLVATLPYNFYLRILTARYLRIKMIDAKNLLITLQHMDNETFMDEINKHCVKAKKLQSEKDIINTNIGIFTKLLTYFNIKDITNYLDFGCNDGLITCSIAKLLNIKADGIDVIDNTNSLINYYQYDGNQLPNTKLYDFITINQVLHHISTEQLNIVLPQLVDKLLPNGYLLLKEHDNHNAEMKLLIELQHEFYTNRHERMPILSLYSKEYWKVLFEHFGLKYVNEFIVEKDPTASFYMLFEK